MHLQPNKLQMDQDVNLNNGTIKYLQKMAFDNNCKVR